MKISRILALAALLGLSSVALADEGEALNISTVTGHTYSHCQVVRVYPDGVAFRHSHGMAKVLFTDLSPEWREHFGYDAAKVEAYDRKVREDRAHARDVVAARQLEVQKIWAEAYVQELQAQAIASAQSGGPGGYWGGYGFLDFGLDNQGGWNGNRCNSLGFNNNNGRFNGQNGAFLGYDRRFQGPSGAYYGYDPRINQVQPSLNFGRRSTFSGFNTCSTPVTARVSSVRTRNNFVQPCRTSGSVRVK